MLNKQTKVAHINKDEVQGEEEFLSGLMEWLENYSCDDCEKIDDSLYKALDFIYATALAGKMTAKQVAKKLHSQDDLIKFATELSEELNNLKIKEKEKEAKKAGAEYICECGEATKKGRGKKVK